MDEVNVEKVGDVNNDVDEKHDENVDYVIISMRHIHKYSRYSLD